MSVASKRRYVTHKVESELYTPVDGDIIAQVRGARGNNLHEVEDEFGETYIVSMPTKFRKAVWIRRGQFVVIRPINEGDKVKAEIEHVLDGENILYIKERNKWPLRFNSQAEQMTRYARRGGKGEDDHPMIDADMLPPDSSDIDEEIDESSNNTDSDSVNESEVEDGSIEKFNPNRSRAPKNCS